MQGTGLAKNPLYLVGVLSGLIVLMWSVTPWLRLFSEHVPPLELTGIALLSAALSSLLSSGRGSLKAACHHPWYAWAIVIGSFAGSSTFFYAALTYAPAPQAVVITYCWPLLFAIASDVYKGRHPAPVTLAGLLLGLVGVYVMQGGGQSPSLLAWLGYMCALGSGLSWVGYSLFMQVYPRPVAPAYPAFFLVAGVVSLGLQIPAGGLIWPGSLEAWLASIALGVGPYGLGFAAWGYVVRHGNPRVIPVLPYTVPVLATIMLVLAGYRQPTPSLFIGCLLVIVACGAVACCHKPRSAA